MSWPVVAALAAPFVAAGQSFDFTIGMTTYTVTLTAGTYRVALAPSSGGTKDALRSLETALNAPSPSLPGGTSLAVTLDDATGLVSITCTSAFALVDLHSTTLGNALGFTAASGGAATTQTANRAPWYLALFVSAQRSAWRPRTPGAAERTAAGVVYSLAGSGTSYDGDLSVDFTPLTPAIAAEVGSPATPLYPAEAYLSDLGGTGTAARAWSVLDVLVAARNAQAALTVTWRTCKSTTTERYFLPHLQAGGLDLEVEHRDERWPRYARFKVSLTLPVSGATETRA